MAKQRYLKTSFWTDPYTENLDPSEKLVFIYFLTNDSVNLSWIYDISIKRIAFETWFDKDMIEKIIQRFTKDEKIYYIDGYIFIKNFIKNQIVNPSVKEWIKREILSKPQSLIRKIQAVPSLGSECLTLLNLTLLNSTLLNLSEEGGEKNSPSSDFDLEEEKICSKKTIEDILLDDDLIEKWWEETINLFVKYRSEKNKKWEERWTKEKTRELNKRLATWHHNNTTNFWKNVITPVNKRIWGVTNLDLVTALNRFEDMRDSIKKGMTADTRLMLVVKLKTLADGEQDMIDILEQSILNSWKDVYELKNKKSLSSMSDVQIWLILFNRWTPEWDKAITDYWLDVKYSKEELKQFEECYFKSMLQK